MRLVTPAPGQTLGEAPPSRPPASGTYDGIFAILSAVFAGGLYLDGWAHVHGHVDQSFFTPWHAVLYSGYLLVASVVGVSALRGRLQTGRPLRSTVAPGYELSPLGAAV